MLTKAIVLEASKIESKQLAQKSSLSKSTFSHDDTSNTNKVLSSSSNFCRSRSKSTQRNNFEKKYRNRSYSQNHRLSFKTLGIADLWIRCRKSNHKESDCRADCKKMFYNLCRKNGHVAKVCIKTLMSFSNIKLNTHLLINSISFWFR